MSKKIPSNFYQEVNVRKLNNVFDSGLPAIGSDDNGKVVKVVENKFALSEDLHTTVVANPEGSSIDELMTLKVGETIYAVNKPTFETIKALKITIENGGQYKTNKPIIEFYDDGGNKANITSSDYTVVCDKTYAGSANMNEVCSIDTPNTPGTFTYTFVNDFNTLKYHFLKLTRGGTFLNDIAKNIKIELSSDGENFLTLFDETSMTWSDAVTYHMYDIATGEEASTLLPIVTSADNGKVLGVVDGVWDKMNVPNELPTVTTENNKKYLEVVGGVWRVSDTVRFVRIVPSISAVTCTDNQDGTFTYDFTFSNITTRNEDNKNIDLSSGIKVDFDTIISIADPSGCVAIAFPNCSASASFKYSNLSYRAGYTPYIATLIKGSVKSSIDKIGVATIDTISATSMSITIRT